MMNKLTTNLMARAVVLIVGVLTFNCVFATAQLYGTTAPWSAQPGQADYGRAYAGVDSSGRYYGNAYGNGGYQLGGVDPNGRRFSYGGGSGYPGYNGYNGDTAFSYGRPGYYGRDDRYNGRDDRYYRYYNGADSTQKTSFFSLLTFVLIATLAFKMFA